MSNYNGSDEHITNVLIAREKALTRSAELKQQRIDKYDTGPKLCPTCGGPIMYTKRHNRFCSSSCSATWNNTRRVVSEESKQKCSNTQLSNNSAQRGTYASPFGHFGICKNEECGAVFDRRIVGRLRRFCSDRCKDKQQQLKYTPEYKQAASDRAKQLHIDGKIKGWSSRSKLKPSYPEQYFINMFTDLNIVFEREIKKGRFFCDFVWEDKQLILEVDGKQHEYPDHVERDKRKDLYLISLGYNVIRIKWYNPVNEINKQLLHSQIQKFLIVLYKDTLCN